MFPYHWVRMEGETHLKRNIAKFPGLLLGRDIVHEFEHLEDLYGRGKAAHDSVGQFVCA